MEELWTEVTKAALAIVIPLIGLAVGAITHKIAQYLNENIHNEYVKMAGNTAIEIVLAVESTMVSQARKAAVDGVITKNELSEIFKNAKKQAVEMLVQRLRSTNAPDSILKVAPDAIEAALMKIKLSPLKAQVSQ